MIRLPSIVALLSLALTAQTAAARIGVGDLTPPITLEALTNVPDEAPAHDALSWDHFDGQTVVLEFWGTWCGPCVAAIPHLNELAEATAGEDVAFLAVTFEETGIVEKFLDKMEMNSWIGHDTDRSMVEAFGVRAWPTTFIVRDGVVLERTHPMQLTGDRLLKLARADAASTAEAAGVAADQAATEAPSAPEPEEAPETAPIFEITVRPTPESDRGLSTGRRGPTDFHATGASLSGLARLLWSEHDFHDVRLDRDERYDIAVSAPNSDIEHVRAIVAAELGFAATLETRTMEGYTARLAPGGIRLDPGLTESVSGSMFRDIEQAIEVTGVSQPVGFLFDLIRNRHDAPIEDETGIDADRLFFIQLTLPREPEAMIAALREQTGIVLTPAKLDREVVVLRAIASGE